MNDEKIMLLDVPAGHGHLKCMKRDQDYVFIVCYSETYHEPKSPIPQEEKDASIPLLGIVFSDVRSVDAYISALSQISAKMKEEQK